MASFRLWLLALVILPFCAARPNIEDFAKRMQSRSHPNGLHADLSNDLSYAAVGPFKTRTLANNKLQVSTIQPDGTDKTINIQLTVTLPVGAATGAAHELSAPFPVVLFVNGFQYWANEYTPYAERLASWGIVCVQYDNPAYPFRFSPLQRIVEDRIEVQYFRTIMAWLRTGNDTAGNSLHGMLDLNRLATAGHSRGAKIAGLLFAGQQEDKITTAFLIDPVDNSTAAPESEAYPSAVKALARAAPAAYALLGAGCLSSRCNPDGPNYKAFFGVAPEGSVEGVVQRAGHAEFASSSWAKYKLAKLACPGAKAGPREVVATALPPMLAWLDKALRPSALQETLFENYLQWAKGQEAGGRLVVTVKPNSTAAKGADPSVPAGSNTMRLDGAWKQEPSVSLQASVV